MKDVQIRLATPDDAGVILRYIHELAVYEREPDAVFATEEGLRDQLSSDRPPFDCFLAELDGESCGFALFFTTYSTWRGLPGIHLEDLYVPESQRGRGVGLALMAALVAVAVERGCGRFEWDVLDWNQPAIDFYDRLGAKRQSGWSTYRVEGEGLQKMLSELNEG